MNIQGLPQDYISQLERAFLLKNVPLAITVIVLSLACFLMI